MALKKGFNPNITNEEYHKDREFLSSSGLKMILKDPYKFQAVYINGEEAEMSLNGAALAFGSYIHMAILEPQLLESHTAIYSGTQRRGTKWDLFYADNSSKVIITVAQEKQANKLLKEFETSVCVVTPDGAVEDCEVMIASFFDAGNVEETLCSKLDGVSVKVRFDFRHPKDYMVIDIKTTAESLLSPTNISTICEEYGYDLSAALYADVAEQETGVKHAYYFCFISKNGGGTRMVRATESFLARGRAKYKRALQRVLKARETGTFFENRIIELE